MIRVPKEFFFQDLKTPSIDPQLLEQAILLETVNRACYQSLAELAQNGKVRLQCQLLSRDITHGQNDLKCYLENPSSSQDRVDRMFQDYAVNPLSLSILGVIDVALNAALNKLEIYKTLRRGLTGEAKNTMHEAILRSLREINFLRLEQQFHSNRDYALSNWTLMAGIIS